MTTTNARVSNEDIFRMLANLARGVAWLSRMILRYLLGPLWFRLVAPVLRGRLGQATLVILVAVSLYAGMQFLFTQPFNWFLLMLPSAAFGGLYVLARRSGRKSGSARAFQARLANACAVNPFWSQVIDQAHLHHYVGAGDTATKGVYRVQFTTPPSATDDQVAAAIPALAAHLNLVRVMPVGSDERIGIQEYVFCAVDPLREKLDSAKAPVLHLSKEDAADPYCSGVRQSGVRLPVSVSLQT